MQEFSLMNYNLLDAKGFTPETGKSYENINGITYECRVGKMGEDFDDGSAWFVSPAGWAFKAIGCMMHPDGLIEWDYSIHGHWIDSRSAPPPKEFRRK